MENINTKDNLGNSISKVLNKTISNKSEDKKNISKFVEFENNKFEKKCKSCMDIKKKITPLVYISIFVMFFTIYGFVSVINKILDFLFSQ